LQLNDCRIHVLNGFDAVAFQVLRGGAKLGLGVLALPKGILHPCMVMKFSGGRLWSAGFAHRWQSAVVHRNRKLQLLERHFDLLTSRAPMPAKLFVADPEHVIRAPEHAICVVNVRMRFRGLRYRCVSDDKEQCSGDRQNARYS